MVKNLLQKRTCLIKEMSRRQFMKIMGGLASKPFIGKFLKYAKPAAKLQIQKGADQPPEYCD